MSLLLTKADREAVLRNEIVHARRVRRTNRWHRTRLKGHRTFTFALWLAVMTAVAVIVGFGSFTAFLVVAVVAAVGVSVTRQQVRARRLRASAARRARRALR